MPRVPAVPALTIPAPPAVTRRWTHLAASTRRWLVRIAFPAVLVAATSLPAGADVTVFAAVQTTNGTARPAVGAAFGYSPSVVGFEVEYAGTIGETTDWFLPEIGRSAE